MHSTSKLRLSRGLLRLEMMDLPFTPHPPVNGQMAVQQGKTFPEEKMTAYLKWG